MKLTYVPSKDWRVSAAYRFGKTKGFAKAAPGYEHVDGGLVANIKYPGGLYVSSEDNHWRAAARDMEEFTLTDFTVGKDVGFGVLGAGGASTLSVGLRHADIRSTSRVAMDGVPNRFVPPISGLAFPDRTMETYTTTLLSDRSFNGVGPSVTWDASLRLWGDNERGHADIDWNVGGGILFGKQSTDSDETRVAHYWAGDSNFATPASTIYNDVVSRSRSDDVTVPNVSLSVGLSYAIDRVKVSTGYSYDRFFDAIDAGYEEAKQYDRTIHGPYLKLSLGFGG